MRNLKSKLLVFVFAMSIMSTLYGMSHKMIIMAQDVVHIDPDEWVIPPTYSYAKPLFDGLIMFGDNSSGDYYYVITNSNDVDDGEWLVPPTLSAKEVIIADTEVGFEAASNMFIVKTADHAEFYDRYGRVKLAGEWTDAYPFESGGAWVQRNDGIWGCIDTEGNVTAEYLYTECTPVGGGSALVKMVSSANPVDNYAIVSKDGEVIKQMELKDMERYDDKTLAAGIKVFYVFANSGQEKLYGALNTQTGKDIVPTGYYDEIGEVASNTTHEMLVKVKRNGMYGLINVDGEEYATAVYDNIKGAEDFSAGTNVPFAILEKDSKYGLASPVGIIFDAQYTEAPIVLSVTTGGQSIYLVSAGDGANQFMYVLDTNFGFPKVNPFQTFIRDTKTGFQVQTKINTTDGKHYYGMVDRFGSEVVPYIYTSLSFFENGYALAAINDVYQLIKLDGEVALGGKAGLELSEILKWNDCGYVNYSHAVAKEKGSNKYGLVEVKDVPVITRLEGKSISLKTNAPSTTTVIWQSMDTSVVTVDNKGKIKAVGYGETSVVCSNLTTEETKVYLFKVWPAITKIEIVPKSVTLKIYANGAASDESIFTPKSHITFKNKLNHPDKVLLTKTSTKAEVANFDLDGNIVAKQYGTATLTFSEPVSKKKSNVKVKVYEYPFNLVITGKNAMDLGKTQTLKASFGNEKHIEKADKAVHWSVSDTSILSVDNKGKVGALKRGAAYVIATSVTGETAIFAIGVDGADPSSAADPGITAGELSVRVSLKTLDEYKQSLQSIKVVSEGQNMTNIVVEGFPGEGYYGAYAVDLDKELLALDADFESFYKGDMWTGDVDANKQYFVETIAKAMTNGLQKRDSDIREVKGKVSSEGKLMFYMTDGRNFYFTGCSPCTYDSFGHGYMHTELGSMFTSPGGAVNMRREQIR